jgi:hypothetical protein
MIRQPNLDKPASKRCRVRSRSNERRVTAHYLESVADDMMHLVRSNAVLFLEIETNPLVRCSS